MPAPAPDDMTDPLQRELWRTLSRSYEDFCGTDETEWPERTRSFQEVLSRMNRKLDEARGG